MSTSRALAWTVWVTASLFYAYQYILRVMPNVMLSDIMYQFNIDAALFGQFSGVYYIGYSLMHLPIGIMLDRFGPRRVLPVCILLTVVGLLPMLYSSAWIYPVLGRVMIGIGSSAAILGTFKIIRMTFDESRFTRLLSFSVTIGLLGAIYGGGPVTYLYNALGYHAVIKIFAITGCVLALVTWILVPNMRAVPQSSIRADLWEVLTNRRIVWSCILAGMMVGPLEGFADVWAAAFLKQNYGFDQIMATSLPSVIFVGMCFGAPLLSLVAEKTGNYLATIAGSGLVMAGAFFSLMISSPSQFMVAMVFGIIGVCCAYQILAIYKASTWASERVAGLTTAIANMIIMSFGYAFHTIIGLVVKSQGGPQVPGAVNLGVAIIPVGLAIGALGFYMLLFRERREEDVEALAA
ncbi:MFS transporter [Legionella geestiana]|uniref:MFS transporter n=1 Tax=Legionella geestiana TaxID=45065 RepID=UPI001092A1A5|nr:MFS transporter [Legionella geestiana]QDQ40753.1 MFS transporter [Legionella geestiana]